MLLSSQQSRSMHRTSIQAPHSCNSNRRVLQHELWELKRLVTLLLQRGAVSSKVCSGSCFHGVPWARCLMA